MRLNRLDSVRQNPCVSWNFSIVSLTAGRPVKLVAAVVVEVVCRRLKYLVAHHLVSPQVYKPASKNRWRCLPACRKGSERKSALSV